MPASESTSFLPDWPRAGQPVLHSGLIKAEPEDFQVWELPTGLPDGEGEHLWVKVRKRDWNTPPVASMLARWAGVPIRDVSYAGLKDRQAVTEQWFSIQLAGKDDPSLPAALKPGVEILEMKRHSRKLRRGALRGNRFEIIVRECAGETGLVDSAVERIRREGVPNYFGEQRFGRQGANIPRALEMLTGKRRIRDRNQRSLLLSAARSLVFNDLLSARISEGIWCTPVVGDLMMLDGSHSLFPADVVDQALLDRATSGEVHPTGILPGKSGKLETHDDAAALEEAVLADHEKLVAGLVKQKVKAARRALRVFPAELQHEWLTGDRLRLGFTLPAGSYATAVLRELIGGMPS